MIQAFKSEIIAFIGARGQSERLPGKNTADLCGKPMIAYSIETALQSSVFTRVIVNSEDEKILRIGEQYGAESYLRPEALSTAKSYVIDVLREMVATMKLPDDTTVGTLFPTAPLRSVEDIRNAYALFRANGGRIPLASVTKFDHKIQLALKLDNEGRLNPCFPEDYYHSTRQVDHQDMYRANYAILFNCVATLKNQKTLIGAHPIPYVMPPERSIDVDYEYQMNFAKAILNLRN